MAGKMWIFAAKTRECNQQTCGIDRQKKWEVNQHVDFAGNILDVANQKMRHLPAKMRIEAAEILNVHQRSLLGFHRFHRQNCRMKKQHFGTKQKKHQQLANWDLTI